MQVINIFTWYFIQTDIGLLYIFKSLSAGLACHMNTILRQWVTGLDRGNQRQVLVFCTAAPAQSAAYPHNVLISSRTISPMRAKVGKTLKKSNRASLLVDQLQSTACSHHIYRRVQYMVIDWGYKKTVTISVTDNSAPIVNQDKKLTLCNGLQKLEHKGLVFVTGCKTFPRTLEGAIKSIYGYL